MAVPITRPAPWPMQLANADIRASNRLYYYATYGLDMRELFEVEGPYDLRRSEDEHVLGKIGSLNPTSWGWTDDKDRRRDFFRSHKTEVLQTARYQLLLNCFSIFEFFIANLLIFLYNVAAEQRGEKEPGFHWRLEGKRGAFVNDIRLQGIGGEDWIKANHKDSVLKDRIELLENVCEIAIRTVTIDIDGAPFGWDSFRSFRPLRHAVAHTASRSSLYQDASLSRGELSERSTFAVATYLRGLMRNMGARLYDLPVIFMLHPALAAGDFPEHYFVDDRYRDF